MVTLKNCFNVNFSLYDEYGMISIIPQDLMQEYNYNYDRIDY